ncbi:TorD/DmsD family molecular chaperone [Seleniivibrio woodruffii]|uniref:Tat proofreading chaperone TorD n=1 Tax=Seleniivibrio woodruffii TaxID=1078050 RepID=A0A4R1KBV6_9BACT|nr:molecular chaperone TorD family protein [Seleniivibrio woodruffii]TCK61954.1 Tat proofreading chaperone TorD [Seleniivibrio woodruffii]TVZ34929.1 TorA maturation chaperone TorD [Seleniivibrio woodruffii]
MNITDSDRYLEAMAAFSFFNKVLLDAPEKEYMEGFRDSVGLLDEWPFPESAESKTGLELLKNYLKNYTESELQPLKDNFNKLFIGPGHLFAPPWESVYKEQDRTIFGEATLKVRNRYRKFGLEIHNLHKEPDDHMAYECAYLNFLCATAAADETAEDVRKEIAEFIKDHPASWVDEFTEKMIENSATDFYKGVAYLLKGSLNEAFAVFS